MSRTTIVMDDTLQDEAKELGINVSEICREAVGEAVQAKRAAKKLGDKFEPVNAEVLTENDDIEVVVFMGQLVRRDDDGNDYYVTSGGRPAVVDEEGFLVYAESVEEMQIAGPARQMLEEVLGEVVTPTFLDI